MGRMKEWLMEIEYLCEEIVEDVYLHGDYKNPTDFQLEVFDDIRRTSIIPIDDPTINTMVINMVKRTIAEGSRN